jgi:hypothetical protein
MQKVSSPIKVKIIARGEPSYPWKLQAPGNTGVWGNCQFIFDRDQDNYDWLVVIDDLSRGYTSQPEAITC